jgi:hypothetical protein
VSDTFTPNLNLTKPAVGASRDTWGTKTNSDWDLVDAVFAGAGSGTSVGLNVGSGKTLSVAGTLTATGTVTLPAAATAGGATIVSTTGTQTLTNKTLTNPAINGFTGDTSVINIGSGQIYKDASGNVGIGTTGLGAKLSIVAPALGASIIATDNAQSTWYLKHESGNLLTYEVAGSAIQRWVGNGAERMRIDGSGNVGIGTSSPGEKLSIAGAANVYASLLSTGGVKTQLNAADATGAGAVGTVTNHPFRLETNNLERVRITADGNVGIGTSSPAAAKLVVISPPNSPSLQLSDATQSTLTILHEPGNLLTYQAGGSAVQRWVGNGIERMRIDASGNVGIGTTAPSAPLDVNGNVAITGTARRITGDFSNATIANRVAFQTSTANASTSFSVIPNGTNTQSDFFAFNSSDPNNASVMVLRVGTTEASVRSGALGTGTLLPMTFHTGASERMRITAAGNVGIGTTAPGSSLEVNGGIRARGGAPGGGGANNNGYAFNGNGGDADSGMFSSADGQVEFYCNAVERARINSAGNFRIGTTAFTGATESRLAVAGTSGATWSERTVTIEHTGGNQPGIGFHAPGIAASIFKFLGPSNRFECRNNDDTAFIDIAANSCISVSDYRLKENIAPFSGGLSAVMQLNPVTFKWKDQNRAAVGFVAHEVQAAIPTAITGVKDEMHDEKTPVFQGIDPLQIVAVLTKAVQELTAKLEAAEARIANLENR